MVGAYGTKGAEPGTTLVKRNYRRNEKPAVLYCHGLNGRAWHAASYPNPEFRLITDEGFPIGAFDLGGPATWGNDTAIDSIDPAAAYMQGAPLEAVDGPFILWAGSMGTLVALNYLREFPANLIAVGVGLPALSLQNLRDQAALTASVEAAFGGNAGYTAALATHNPIAATAEIAALEVPLKLWGSSDDDVCPPDIVAQFVDETGCEFESLGATGHTVPASAARGIADWLASHA